METTVCLDNGFSLLIEHKLPISLKEGDIIKLQCVGIEDEKFEITGIWKTIKDVDTIDGPTLREFI